jgi:hypothetical protein
MCIINHTYQFIFVHVPKSAGTAVAQYLSALTTYQDEEIGATRLGEALAPHYWERFRIAKHSTISEIGAVVGNVTLNRYVSFCVVRNPYDRVRSLYAFLKRWQQWRPLPNLAQYVSTFESHRDINDFIRSPFFQTPGPDRLFNPQVFWMENRADGRIMVDRFVHLERLEAELEPLLLEIGVSRKHLGSAMVPIVNVSTAGSPAPLDDSAREIVRTRYARDFELLGYDTDDDASA